jgi:hypothetical protein
VTVTVGILPRPELLDANAATGEFVVKRHRHVDD